MPSQPVSPSPPPRRRWALVGILLRVGAVLSVLALGLEVYRVLAGSNFHVVIPGAVYRCSQPSPDFLNDVVKRYGIRTVINLRGCCDTTDWYRDECRALTRLEVAEEDVGLSAGRLPSVQALRELIRVFDHSAYPILIHCNRGIDRTGMTSAVALLLHSDASLADARGQLGPRFGHLPLGRTGNMERFLDLYREWLEQKGLEHTRANFRRWAEYEYCPGECSASLAVVGSSGSPIFVPTRRAFSLTIHCHNTSVKPWRFRPGDTAGIHLQFFLHDAQDHLVTCARAGCLHCVVPPGESITLTLPLPALPAPGRYLLRADLVDEQHAFFFQTGSEPLIVDLEAL
jgi:hypothetical protein